MRLLHTQTGQLCSFDGPSIPPYAILSHVWSRPGDPGHVSEQSYQDIIQASCAITNRHGYEYLWIDTCCINKSSSAELSESINSMFTWYARSRLCYAYLADVDDNDRPDLPQSQFRRSRWFTRAWTLQELIAPSNVVFLSKNWNVIGSKSSLAHTIKDITNIDVDVLTGRRTLREVCVAQRMSWASRREASKVEDEAYSLLGIFGRNSFSRLQEAILKHIPDQSLFAWGPRHHLRSLTGDTSSQISRSESGTHESCLFATSPRDFSASFDLCIILPKSSPVGWNLHSSS
ncbi:heterokaryon incompatibility protein-domain-containing protein [Epithele typhae]|uniref:heterokaryon incompatibility protein-domain-containing protein n=1 Tax=Epithele typhae TaxID=378194 RepID=UPI0020081592|nr:heterokaryon incompatibility protein-domain-containing protein [Epithele typhae]KAH9915047.1 heterokaryon incompatibility protein-domain-containing protein [Epithele typhae]